MEGVNPKPSKMENEEILEDLMKVLKAKVSLWNNPWVKDQIIYHLCTHWEKINPVSDI